MDAIATMLRSCPDEVLVPDKVLSRLLRIQSKYMDQHPCLCTSRFRRALRQLDGDRRMKLAALCGALHHLTAQSSELLYETTLSYKWFARKIFGLSSSSSPGDSLAEEAVLARLVSDYRAIFVIEEHRYFGFNDDRERRKRHEDGEEPSEHVKLMKISCPDISMDESRTIHQMHETPLELKPSHLDRRKLKATPSSRMRPEKVRWKLEALKLGFGTRKDFNNHVQHLHMDEDNSAAMCWQNNNNDSDGKMVEEPELQLFCQRQNSLRKKASSLTTIPEDEAISLTLASPSHRCIKLEKKEKMMIGRVDEPWRAML